MAEEDYKRERGIYTPRQIAGFELMLAGAVSDEIVGGVANVHRDGKVAIVNYVRQECTCNGFVKSKPRMACRDIWAVRYTVEPPDADEVADLRKLRSGEMLKQEARESLRSAHPHKAPDLQERIEAGIRGGYKRFGKIYHDAITDEFSDSLRFALALFEQMERVYEFRAIKGRGRLPMRLSRLLFAFWLYTYLRCSLRATEGFLKFLAEVGFIGEDYPDHATLGAFIVSKDAHLIIRGLIALTAEPFRDLGPLVLAGDGTGAAAKNNKFFDYRSQRCDGKQQTRAGAKWYKAHPVCGTDTLQTIVIRITDHKASEKTVLRKELLPELEAMEYECEQFLLDGGYNATMIRDEIVQRLRAVPLVPWAKNSKNAIPRRWRNVVQNVDLIKELHRLCTKEPEKFKIEGYRYRVKVECLFAAVKERFGAYVRTFTGWGPQNEIAMKFACYNIHLLLLAAKIYGLSLDSLTQEKAA